MENKLKIFITGGGGYIGSCIVEELLNYGYEIVLYDLFLYGKDIFSNVRNKKNLHFFKGDIRDKNKLKTAMKNTDIVIHLAGIVGDLACSVDEKLSWDINVIGTNIVKDVAKQLKIRRFIFASSCSVYGIAKRVVSENSKLNPLSIYAQTKVEAEKELLKDKDKDFYPTILRFTTVFGDSLRPRFDLVANLFIAQAYKTGKITVMGGSQWRPFIHVKDIAFAVRLVLESPIEKVNREIFNVGDNLLHLRIIDLAKVAKKVAKFHKNVEIITSANPWDKRNYRVSFKKIHSTINFSAQINLEKGLKEIYRKFKTHIYKQEITNPLYSNAEMIKKLRANFK